MQCDVMQYIVVQCNMGLQEQCRRRWLSGKKSGNKWSLMQSWTIQRNTITMTMSISDKTITASCNATSLDVENHLTPCVQLGEVSIQTQYLFCVWNLNSGLLFLNTWHWPLALYLLYLAILMYLQKQCSRVAWFPCLDVSSACVPSRCVTLFSRGWSW